MDVTKMLFGGALIGTLVSAWSTIKAVAWKLCNIVLKKVVIEETLTSDLLIYLRENYKHWYLHDRKYMSNRHYVRQDSRYQNTGWEDFTNCSILFWTGKLPFFYSQSKTTSKNADGSTSENAATTIYYIRGTLNFDTIIKGAITRRNKISLEYDKSQNRNYSRFFIKYVPENKVMGSSTQHHYDFTSVANRIITHDLKDLGLNVRDNGINKLVLTKENKEIIQLAELWFNNKKWYQEKDIPWKMGWLLHGPPGTGKTLLSRRIAEHLRIPIFVYKLGMIGDGEFSEKWADMQSWTPCVALIEDFDNVFHGRENVAAQCDPYAMGMFPLANDGPANPGETKKEGRPRGWRLSFDNLLNTLDGAERYEGILTIITTNHIDKVDPALLDRPGRIDKKIELTYLTDENKYVMIDMFLSDMPAARELALQYIATHRNEPITPAQLQAKCTELALKEFYKENLEKQ